MIGCVLKLNAGEPVWPELAGEKVVHLANGAPPMQVAMLDGGMASGRPSVALRFDLPDGSFVIAETSARLFCTAARAILARYPQLFEEGAPDAQG